MRHRPMVAPGLLFVLFGCQSEVAEAPAEDAGPLSGVWELTSIAYESPDTTWTNQDPAVGQLMFHGDRYSLTLIPGGRTRTQPDSATDLERLAVLDDFISNAGRYSVNGSALVTRPHIAKTIGGMAPGSAPTHQYRVLGDTLILEVNSAWIPAPAKATYRWLKVAP
jgi:hypothetical protein